MLCAPWGLGMLSREKAPDRFQQEVWDSLPGAGYLVAEIQAPRMKPRDWDPFTTAQCQPASKIYLLDSFQDIEVGGKKALSLGPLPAVPHTALSDTVQSSAPK